MREQRKYFFDIPGPRGSRLSAYKNGMGFINFDIIVDENINGLLNIDINLFN